MARSGYTIASRSIWYVMKTLVIITAILLCCFGIFVEGMYVSNLYILVTEGLEFRAEVILQDGPVIELTEYFTEEFVKSDSILYEKRYELFEVEAFDYRVDIESFNVMPWSKHAVVKVKARLASINASIADAKKNPDAKLPEWDDGIYNIHFTREGSRWYMSDMELVSNQFEEEVLPTPDMSLLEGQSK